MIVTHKILTDFLQTRQATDELCAPLKTEDYVVQPADFVSPPKWHLGHTTWFFEELVLKPFKKEYTVFDPAFSFLFNSYYQSLGDRAIRDQRGTFSRPTVEEIYRYRDYVTNHVSDLLEDALPDELLEIMETGIQHEKQHQELLLTDLKYILGTNPLFPKYAETVEEHQPEKQKSKWIKIPEGIYEIGHLSKDFCFDNEREKHHVFLQPYKISSKLITNDEYLEFMDSGGYESFEWWHDEGWTWLQSEGIQAPLYWHKIEGAWYHYTLQGLKPIDPEAPVTHISWYEAAAYASWRGHRLPTEFEWEVAQELFYWGKRWEWTESAYTPYPGYKRKKGPLGEYNAKFMVNQKVLRGGSIASPKNHIRYTYRNFFHPPQRWQYTGIRLAQ